MLPDPRCPAPSPPKASSRRTSKLGCKLGWVLTLWGLLTGCASPYRTARTVGATGGVLAAVGGALWVVGDDVDRDAVRLPGVTAAIVGAACIATAAALFAAQTSCQADADCPNGYVCKELPAPAGLQPYRQCVPR